MNVTIVCQGCGSHQRERLNIDRGYLFPMGELQAEECPDCADMEDL